MVRRMEICEQKIEKKSKVWWQPNTSATEDREKTKEEEGEEEKIRHQAIRIIVRLVFLVFGSWLILNATTVSDANGKAKQHTCCYVDITASVCCCCCWWWWYNDDRSIEIWTFSVMGATKPPLLLLVLLPIRRYRFVLFCATVSHYAVSFFFFFFLSLFDVTITVLLLWYQ